MLTPKCFYRGVSVSFYLIGGYANFYSASREIILFDLQPGKAQTSLFSHRDKFILLTKYFS